MAANPSVALPDSVTVSNGSATASIPVTPIDNSVAECPETVIVTLSPSGNYTIGASQWIIDPTTEPGVIPSHPFLGGYAILDCGTLPVNASLLYSFYDRSGYKQGEATVFQSVIGHRVQIIGDQTENARVGIAIVNDTAASQTSTIRVGDDQGQMAATRNVTIPAHSNKVGFLSELVGWTGTKGQVLIDCPSGCAAIALRYTGAVFTTIPSSIRLQ